MATANRPPKTETPVPIIRWLAGNRSTSVPATRVRCRIPARLLRAGGLDSRLIRRREDPARAPADVLVIQDPRSDEDAAAAHGAAARGVTVVVDLSDPVLARSDPARRAAADATTVTIRNTALAPLVEHDVVVPIDDAVEWAHPSPHIRPRPLPGEPARLIWFGVGRGLSEGTGIDELATLGPTLAAVARRRRIELLVVTDDRARADALLKDRSIPGRSVDWSPWRLRSVLAASHLCLLPAVPGEAARARSANRAVTSLVQGVAVVAGPVPAYEVLGAGVAFGSWDTNIDRLLADQDTVERQIGQGRDAVRRRFYDDEIVRQWRAAVGQAPTALTAEQAVNASSTVTPTHS